MLEQFTIPRLEEWSLYARRSSHGSTNPSKPVTAAQIDKNSIVDLETPEPQEVSAARLLLSLHDTICLRNEPECPNGPNPMAIAATDEESEEIMVQLPRSSERQLQLRRGPQIQSPTSAYPATNGLDYLSTVCSPESGGIHLWAEDMSEA